jgi:hypothetical protein
MTREWFLHIWTRLLGADFSGPPSAMLVALFAPRSSDRPPVFSLAFSASALA